MDQIKTDTRLVDAVHNACAVASSVEHEVDRIANLLFKVGMEKLANQLWDAMGALVVPMEELSEAYGADLSARLKHNQDMTGSLLMLALNKATEAAQRGKI